MSTYSTLHIASAVTNYPVIEQWLEVHWTKQKRKALPVMFIISSSISGEWHSARLESTAVGDREPGSISRLSSLSSSSLSSDDTSTSETHTTRSKWPCHSSTASATFILFCSKVKGLLIAFIQCYFSALRHIHCAHVTCDSEGSTVSF